MLVKKASSYCPHRLAVRTSPFHGGNRGSSPLGDAIFSVIFFSCIFFKANLIFCSQQELFFQGEKMKMFFLSFAFLLTFNLNATNNGILCHQDGRMNNGDLKEVSLVLSPNGYTLQSRFLASLNSPVVEITDLADQLTCRLDEKAPVAFCKNPDGTKMVYFKERRETFYDSLVIEDKKKVAKFIDVEIMTNNDNLQKITFDHNNCEVYQN